MAVRERTPKLTRQQLARGLYLEDGVRLYRVLAVVETLVELEDCGQPDGLPRFVPVSEVVQRMRLVRQA